MKVNEFTILFDKDEYKTGEIVSGTLNIKTNEANLGDVCNLFLKLYDKLSIEWEEHQLHTIFSKVFSTLKKPYQLNNEIFLDGKKTYTKNEIYNESHTSIQSYEFLYPFKFQLPQLLQGTVCLPNANCNYYLKAYLTDDELVSKHYQQGVNVFTEFFKALNHTYAKAEIKIFNEIINIDSMLKSNKQNTVEKFYLQSSNYKIKLSIPKSVFYSNEMINIHIEVEHATLNNQSPVYLHKIAFKLYQYVKVYAEKPLKKSRLFDYLIKHETKKTIEQNRENRIVLDEEFQIPSKLLSSTSRRISHPLDVEDYDELPVNEEDGSQATTSSASSAMTTADQMGIRINYKFGIEFWKNFLIEESEIFIPIMIDPEI